MSDASTIVSVDELMGGILSHLDTFRGYVERDDETPEGFEEGFDFARHIVRSYHLAKSLNVRCHCDDGPDPEATSDGDWKCADCGALLMTEDEDLGHVFAGPGV